MSLTTSNSLENGSSHFFLIGVFSNCHHISLLFEGVRVMQSLDLFCSQDILLATYRLFVCFIVNINKCNSVVSSPRQRAFAY